MNPCRTKAAFWRLENMPGRCRSHRSALCTRHRISSKARGLAFEVVASQRAGSLAAAGHRFYWPASRPALSPQPSVDAFDTAIGGHRIIPLVDGSRIELNTATNLRTLISKMRRDVWLDRGEAFFEVAHIEGSAFVVHAGPRLITVVGTQFSVRRDGDK